MFKEAAFSDVRKNVIFLLLLVSVFAAGCRTANAPPANQNMREYVTENGLTVKIPENLTARKQGDGFIIEPSDGSNRNVRFPVEISVSFLKESMPSADEFSEEKTVGSKTVRYNIQKTEGGSGGNEYIFKAFETVSGGRLYYETVEQNKYSEPEFNTVWQIIENTSKK